VKKEKEIKEFVEKDDHGDLETPTAAFITFETTTGVCTALQSNSSKTLKETEILPG